MSLRFTLIQNVIQKRKRQVDGKGFWRELHEEWGVGRLQGGQLYLTHDDLDLLRQRTIQVYGADPRTLDTEKDRTALSADTSNEKLSRQRAFGRLLRVAVPGHGVIVAPADGAEHGETFLPTPAGVLLSVEANQLVLDPDTIKRVLVIENGQLMERWWEVVPYLPEPWRHDTLIAYRGHRQDLRSLLDWIKAHQDSITLGFYGDFDPYGVRIGLRSYAPLVPPERFWLFGPEDSTRIPLDANKADTFALHERALRFLEGHIPASSGFRSMVNAIRQGEWAVTQEALLAHGMPLRGYQASGGDLDPLGAK